MTDRPHCVEMPLLSGEKSRLKSFQVCVGHRAWPCLRMQLRDVNYEPEVAFPSKNPTCLAGAPGEVPANVHTMCLPGKVLLIGMVNGI